MDEEKVGLVISTDVRWEFSAELDVLRDIKECRTICGLEDCIQAREDIMGCRYHPEFSAYRC
jgi:hypothetical protein